ncbi:hypothetical protein [Corynebacterium bouchesdurhonense]|uniref:hypothetical protein n=1 Tax=Corynebacterium bouchesdurhonense TaxID=1720192 RepID=UPI000830AD44|nr:hypothetical protein [Corynebacterium bouchesdurhonense]
MKRMNKNAIALATAGALTLAVAPAAMAQIPNPATIENGGQTCYLHKNGKTYVASADKTQVDAANLTASDICNAPAQTSPQGDDEQPFVNPDALPQTRQQGDKTYYLHNSGKVYVLDRNLVNTPLEEIPADQKAGTLDMLEGNEEQDQTDLAGSSKDPKDIAKAVAAVAAAAVGTAIIINGVKYFVNKDKQTLVQDPNRVNAEPSAEEKAKSEELVKANPNTVASQTGASDAQAGAGNAAAPAANGERGIGASTGVNKLPAGILSLLLASLLGAAAFVFGRRQLV